MVTRDDQWGEAEVDQMSEKLQSTIQGRSDAITGRLDAIVEKITEVEDKFDAEMAKIPVDIKRRGEELTKMLVSRDTNHETKPSATNRTCTDTPYLYGISFHLISLLPVGG